MVKARGKTKRIIQTVGQVQGLIGSAINLHWDDINPSSFEKAQNKLSEAFDLCVKITGMYDPLESEASDDTR